MSPSLILLLFALLPSVAFLLLFFRERRSLWLGFFFVLAAGSLFLGLLVPGLLVLDHEYQLDALTLLLVILGLILLLALLMAPLSLVVVFYYSGFRLIRREGVSLTNLLSLSVGTAMLVSLFFVPSAPNSVWAAIYGYVAALVTYLSLLASSYVLSAGLNLLPVGRKNLDYIVVLGSGLIGDRVTPLLAGRVDKGIEVYRKNPGSKLIMTGGQGPDEEVPEGLAMARYAQEQGVPAGDIIIEDQAVNTHQNLTYSWALMSKPQPRVLVATTGYHLFRALLLARSLGLACVGAGSRTKLYFSVNATIREFIGYLVMTKRLHISMIVIFSLLYLAFFILSLYLESQGYLVPAQG